MYRRIHNSLKRHDFSEARGLIAAALQNCSIYKWQLVFVIWQMKRIGYSDVLKASSVLLSQEKKEWDMNYLISLCSAIVSGDVSERLLLHSWAVSKFLHRNNKATVVECIFVGIVICAILLLIVRLLL